MAGKVARPARRAGEVFIAFLKLGLTSFGGPVAHLGYFRTEFVTRRRWLDERAYADLVALCQFLPGPASSQVGFALGVLRGGGLWGGVLAWLAFTLPSAVLLFVGAVTAATLQGPVAAGALHGLKLVAVAVVAQAVWGMARTLTPDVPRVGIALAAIGIVVLSGGAFGQVAAIALGACAGLFLCRRHGASVSGHLEWPISRRVGAVALGLFVTLLLAGPLLRAAGAGSMLTLFDAFYRSGAFVFGGGHVVLPLLQAEVVATGWVSDATFLTGYGLAQAVPGPLFTFAAYLGAVMNGAAGAAVALIALMLPGLLLVYGVLPFWDVLRTRALAQAGMRGANAAVVGILVAALHSPVWTGSVRTPYDMMLAAAGFLALVVCKLPPWVVVLALAAAGTAL